MTDPDNASLENMPPQDANLWAAIITGGRAAFGQLTAEGSETLPLVAVEELAMQAATDAVAPFVCQVFQNKAVQFAVTRAVARECVCVARHLWAEQRYGAPPENTRQ
ncbi:hypothetical protein [Muricoccus aerilatus]|uniref:hypothetical protein n=1 Tax=Muricoccus aerilatus TaxID=452982 RepID=UPI0012EC1794|nr:hypothetical protein [Roseomonas aerilata]